MRAFLQRHCISGFQSTRTYIMRVDFGLFRTVDVGFRSPFSQLTAHVRVRRPRTGNPFESIPNRTTRTGRGGPASRRNPTPSVGRGLNRARFRSRAVRRPFLPAHVAFRPRGDRSLSGGRGNNANSRGAFNRCGARPRAGGRLSKPGGGTPTFTARHVKVACRTRRRRSHCNL